MSPSANTYSVEELTKIFSSEPPNLDKRFSTVKKSLIKPENVEAVKQSWNRLLVAIEEMVRDIREQGDGAFPSVNWSEVKSNNNKIPDTIGSKFRETGVLLVRDVIDSETISQWKDSMVDFITNHPEVGGYPKPDITNWFAFWTKGQVEARSHPEIVQLMKTMSDFFYVEDPTLPIDIDSRVEYLDAFRVRPPGQQITLDLHLDSGSIERWEDSIYRDVYAPIFEGRWEDFEPFKLDTRAFARSDLYSSMTERPTATSALRTLQGWLALSSVKSKEGTIRMLPNIKLVNAYIMLRPFFWQDNGEIDLETPKFPGALVGSGQFFISEELHPHLEPLQTVMSIPYANAGDYVFWHCDVAHEVDKEHIGNSDSSVFFNALCPLVPYNVDNLVHVNKCFQTGDIPRDFQKDANTGKVAEGTFEDHGARIENILSQEGLQALGLKPFDDNEPGITEGQKKIRKFANDSIKRGQYNEENIYVYYK